MRGNSSDSGKSGLAVGAQNVDDLVSDHVLDSLAGGLQVLPGIEVIGMLGEVLADVAGHGQTDVGVDVDLAHGQLGSLTQLLLGDACKIEHDLSDETFEKIREHAEKTAK